MEFIDFGEVIEKWSVCRFWWGQIVHDLVIYLVRKFHTLTVPLSIPEAYISDVITNVVYYS